MLLAVAVIALILLGIVAFLAVPVEFVFHIQHDETKRNDAAVVLLFGMIRIPLTARADNVSREKAVKIREMETRPHRQGKAYSLLRNAYVRRRLLRFVHGLLSAIKIETFDLHVRLGLDDPADTGRLWGIVGPLSSLLSGIRTAHIRIEPDFSAEVFSVQTQGRITVIPLQILSISLRFFLSPQVIRTLAMKA